VRPDGTVEYYRWECRPWRQTDGSIGGLVTYSEITTERKLAEQKLKESEEKFRTLFERMAQGVVYQDADYKITEANPAALRILGLTLDQIQGRTSMDPRWRSIHEDGSDFPGETHAAIVALQTGQVVKNVVMGVFNPQSESYHWININAVPQFRPGEDKPYQVFTTFEDITVLKQHEMQLNEQLDELRRWHATVIGREERVLELKQEVNELLRLAGRPPRYLSVEDYIYDE
jgi:PAS domain S-box-containing protein